MSFCILLDISFILFSVISKLSFNCSQFIFQSKLTIYRESLKLTVLWNISRASSIALGIISNVNWFQIKKNFQLRLDSFTRPQWTDGFLFWKSSNLPLIKYPTPEFYRTEFMLGAYICLDLIKSKTITELKSNLNFSNL